MISWQRNDIPSFQQLLPGGDSVESQGKLKMTEAGVKLGSGSIYPPENLTN